MLTPGNSRKIIYFSILFLVVSAIYARTISIGFFNDDFPLLIENPWITNPKHITDIFSSPLWAFYKGEYLSGPSNYYRPMMHMIYMGGYHLFGLDPRGYHLINLLFHLLNSILVFLIASKILSSPKSAYEEKALKSVGQSPAADTAAVFSLFASLIFAAHHVNVEAVAWVAAVGELSFTFFCLLSIYFYISGARAIMRGLSLASFTIALFSKETALMLPLVLVAYEFLFKGLSFKSVKNILPLFIVAGVFFYFRSKIVGSLDLQSTMTNYGYLLSIIMIGAQYIEKLLVPFEIKRVYSSAHPLLLSDLFALEIISGVVFVTLIAFAFIKKIERKTLVLCVLWILIVLLPALMLLKYIQGEGTFAARSRYLYFSTAGFSILFASWFQHFSRRFRWERTTIVVTIFFVIIYSAGAISALVDWKDEFTYWEKAVDVAPSSPTIHANLGVLYAEKGLYEDAVKEYEAALKLAPETPGIHSNLGVAYYNLKEMDKALMSFERALSLLSDEARKKDVYFRMGIIYLQRGDLGKTTGSFERAIHAGGPDSNIYNLLGLAYAQAGYTEKAQSAFEEALSIDPQNNGARQNLGRLLNRIEK